MKRHADPIHIDSATRCSFQNVELRPQDDMFCLFSLHWVPTEKIFQQTSGHNTAFFNLLFRLLIPADYMFI